MNSRSRSAVVLLCLTILLTAGLVPQLNAESWGPWQAPASALPSPSADQTQPLDPLDLALRIFQKYISPVDGARCPMYPTCSAYARQALRAHGPLLGSFLTADRLIHESDPLEQQSPILKWGRRRFYDPLKNNDFWLTGDPPTFR